MTEGMAASSQCARLVSEGKLKEAQDLLTQSQTLWPANIENARLKFWLDDLAKSQAASTSSAAAAAVAAQAASVAPQKPTPSPSPITPAKP
jgi:hypothetical protein